MMLTWLADVLRAEGLTVHEYPGWQTRGRPGTFAPRGWLLHHDASAKGLSLYEPKFLAETGRPAEGIPAPLSQTWVDKLGDWWVLAAGRCNHAGAGSGWGTVRAGMGNTDAGGTEWDHTVGEDVTDVEWDSLTRGFAAISRRLDLDPARAVMGHREYAPARKIDPTEVDLARFRRDVAALQNGEAPVTPAEMKAIADLVVDELLTRKIRNGHTGADASVAALITYGNEAAWKAAHGTDDVQKVVEALAPVVARAAADAVEKALATGLVKVDVDVAVKGATP